MAAELRSPVRSALGGTRRWAVLGILGAGLTAIWLLDLHWTELGTTDGGIALSKRFLSGALHPAWTYERPPPEGSPLFLAKIAGAAWETLRFALVGVSLAIALGLPLGALASSTFWEGSSGTTPLTRALKKAIVPVVRGGMALVRSIHELLWAVFFLAAIGLNPFTAVFAIALPYAGIIGKIFAELIDEVPSGVIDSYRGLGASREQVFFLALIPRTLPDLIAYLMYRLETGIRSSAVMGFLGIPTLGNFLRLSFENAQYREVWTCLYVMLGLCIIFDLWSGSVRKHLVVRN